MKVSDFIIDFLCKNEVTDMFGYPGAVVCHLMDSARKKPEMNLHLNYHEQASAFAACGYGLGTGKLCVAYSNGGPGATNLVTGIANAYYDSIPSIFICGQVDTTAMKNDLPIRQKGIQEIPISKLMKPICKGSYIIKKAEDVKYYMERALYEAKSGRPGPIVLEIPANIQRSEIQIEDCISFKAEENKDDAEKYADYILREISKSKRPCFIIGNGVKVCNLSSELLQLIERFKIPMVFTLPAFDLFPHDYEYNFGFLGNNGDRYSNLILCKSDLIISCGSRLDVKQVGERRDKFAKNAKLIRIDIDNNELSYRVRPDEIQICMDLRKLFLELNNSNQNLLVDFSEWVGICKRLKRDLDGYDLKTYHNKLQTLLNKIRKPCVYTADVGQHEIYMVQSLRLKQNQQAILSLGLASMGFGIPAAIGAYYSTGKTSVCVCGDGGFQMNSQELQFLAREDIPVKIIVFNNNSLGMIREFQERNFNKNCVHSVAEESYTVPDFGKLAKAYGINYTLLKNDNDINQFEFNDNHPEIIELIISEMTTLYPRFVKNKDTCYMAPEMPEEKIKKYLEL